MTLTTAINKAHEGELKGLIVIGENPMVSDPDLHHVEEALDKLDFLLVQDIFLTETARKADVVLPGVTFAEKEGTFTNTERRAQRVRKAVSAPGQARQDWEILCDLSTRLGYPMSYNSPEEIFEEIRTLTPSYAGMTYTRLEGSGLQWPCPTEEHGGTLYLHKEKFNRGRGLFHAIEFKEAAELPDDEYPLILTTGRSLYHYHTGTMTRKAAGLDIYMPENVVQINKKLAEEMEIADGEVVKVSTRRGSINLKSELREGIDKYVIFTYFHFAEAAANRLTNADVLDPVAGIPEYKVSAAKLEKYRERLG